MLQSRLPKGCYSDIETCMAGPGREVSLNKELAPVKGTVP